MRNINLILAVFILHLPGIFCQVMRLSGPIAVAKDKSITLNCTSSVSPIGEYAEILVNDKSHTSLRRIGDTSCKCDDVERNCKMDSCACSSKGLWYSINYTCGSIDQYVTFKCVMEFDTYGKLVDEVRVKILDITGPVITAYPELPVITDTNVTFKCMVTTTTAYPTITWDCLNLTSPAVLHHKRTTYWSEISLCVTKKMGGDVCSCTVKTRNFSQTETIKVEVENLTLLMSDDEIVCENFKSVTLVCVISGELYKYGFNIWTHKVNEMLIRDIQGHNVKNESVITIDPCSYQDSGEYTCTAWNQHHGHTFIVNKTTTVNVLGPPVITESTIKRNSSQQFVVTFYMASEQFALKWYHFTDILPNTTNQLQLILPVYLKLPVYGKLMDIHGYMAIIEFQNVPRGTYYFRVKNIYGEAEKKIEQDEVIQQFQLREVILVLSGLALLILTASVTSILIRYYCTNSNSNHGNAHVAIYHAAPKMDNSINVYDDIGEHYDYCINDAKPTNHTDVKYNDVKSDPYLTVVDEDATYRGSTQSIHNYIEVL